MDIAKIRKKLKEASNIRSQSPEVSATERQTDSDTVTPSLIPPPKVKEEELSEAPAPHLSGESERERPQVDIQVSFPPENVDLLVFKLSGEEYSFRLEDIQEILKKQFITSVPLAPPSIIGITSLRGKVIPVIDLSLKLLGIPSKRDRKSRILIMEGRNGTVGCMVDEVEGVVRSTLQERREVPEEMKDKEKAFIEAVFVVNGRFITLLKKEIIEIGR